MKKFIYSAQFALQGVREFFSHNRNGRIQMMIGTATIALGFILSISPVEWLLILFCIGLVLSLEMINSAIENYCDLVTTEFHTGIKIVKDIAAGAVLVASIVSLIIGLIIFIPALVQISNFLK